MKEINILEAPIFSDYFAEFINSEDEYSITYEFMKENIFIVGVCNCGEPYCSSVYLITKKPLAQSKQQIETNRFDNNQIFFNVYDKCLDFDAVGGLFPYKNEILKLIKKSRHKDV